MKTTSLLIALSVGFMTTGLMAADKAKDNTATGKAPDKAVKTAAQAPQVEKNVPITGSYIRRDVRRNGLITDSATPVYVIDSETIRNSGAADLSQLLLRRGFRR